MEVPVRRLWQMEAVSRVWVWGLGFGYEVEVREAGFRSANNACMKANLWNLSRLHPPK